MLLIMAIVFVPGVFMTAEALLSITDTTPSKGKVFYWKATHKRRHQQPKEEIKSSGIDCEMLTLKLALAILNQGI